MQRTLQLRRNILGLVLIALLVLAPGLSAPTAAYEPVDAEKLIKGCDGPPNGRRPSQVNCMFRECLSRSGGDHV
jgi:hypothetical protein